MSYVRMNYFEYISEEAADELEAQYVQNAPINFPDAIALVFLRTGPKTASLSCKTLKLSRKTMGNTSNRNDEDVVAVLPEQCSKASTNK